MSTNTLTERYVHEVVRRIPADQRDDVAEELRTTIADTVDARNPADPAAAEREVLTEMGDPIRLAARYAGRPLALIGPELYPTYVRLLRLLLSTVLPVVTVVVVVIDVLDKNDLGSIIGSGIGAVLTIGAQMIAWLTVVFALIERSRQRDEVIKGSTTEWTPDQLPEMREAADKSGITACATAVWDLVLIGLIVWQSTAKPYRADNGERIQVLDPALWSGWIWPMLAGLAALVVLNLIWFATRNWTMTLAVPHAIAQAVFALPLAWILHQQKFFNPEFLASITKDWTVPDTFYTVAALGVLAVAGSEIVQRFRETRRS
ncbi:HAAS signaling domain-containing protein [Micromonospora sp. NPDC003197]